MVEAMKTRGRETRAEMNNMKMWQCCWGGGGLVWLVEVELVRDVWVVEWFLWCDGVGGDE